MSGNAKPNIEGLKEEIIPTIIKSAALYGSATGLFDGNAPNSNNSSSICFWDGNHMTAASVDLLIPNKCNIWRCGTVSYKNYNAPLQILKYNGSSYDDVTDLYPQTLTAIDNTQWEKTISNLPAGQYEFHCAGVGKLRLDSEWYVEKCPNIKYLIKQETKYYSIKDNELTELGIPPDDTQKQQWFDDYGVDDLKEALFTLDANGNKLIDSLNDQFEIRMMKAK